LLEENIYDIRIYVRRQQSNGLSCSGANRTDNIKPFVFCLPDYTRP
jgi:hypothetical protein